MIRAVRLVSNWRDGSVTVLLGDERVVRERRAGQEARPDFLERSRELATFAEIVRRLLISAGYTVPGVEALT